MCWKISEKRLKIKGYKKLKAFINYDIESFQLSLHGLKSKEQLLLKSKKDRTQKS